MAMIMLPLGGKSETTPVWIRGRVCPVCGRDHSVFMQRSHHRLLFLFSFFRLHYSRQAMCTRCVRHDIAAQAPKDMLCAHVVWPLLFCLLELSQLVFSYWKEWSVRKGWLAPVSFGREVWKDSALAAAAGSLLGVPAGVALVVMQKTPAQFWGCIAVLVVAVLKIAAASEWHWQKTPAET